MTRNLPSPLFLRYPVPISLEGEWLFVELKIFKVVEIYTKRYLSRFVCIMPEFSLGFRYYCNPPVWRHYCYPPAWAGDLVRCSCVCLVLLFLYYRFPRSREWQEWVRERQEWGEDKSEWGKDNVDTARLLLPFVFPEDVSPFCLPRGRLSLLSSPRTRGSIIWKWNRCGNDI